MPRPIDAISVLCAQLTRYLLAIAKFLLEIDSRIRYDIVMYSKYGHDRSKL